MGTPASCGLGPHPVEADVALGVLRGGFDAIMSALAPIAMASAVAWTPPGRCREKGT